MGFLFQLIFPVFGYVFILSATAEDHRGTEFMLSFIHPKRNDGNPILLISAEDRASVTITIPSLDLILINDIEPGETWKPTLSRDLRYKAYFTTAQSAVNVTSTFPVTVYVYDGVGIRSSGYMALPLHALSTSYIAVTYNGQTDLAYPVLLLVAITDNTIVDVLYRLSSGQCDEHITGETSSHTLHAYDVYGVRCTGDFTGTYIVSNKPLVVISGHQKTNVSGSNVDSLQEMLIPVDQFGLSFVLIDPLGSTRGSINRIVSSSDNTEICSSTGETFLLNAYEYVDIDTGISGQQCINSNFPVLAVSFTKSVVDENLHERSLDAAMYIVPATNMFTTSIYIDYGLSSLLSTDEFVSIAFVFSRNDTPQNLPPTSVHEVISSCPYKVYKMTVTAWPVVYSEGSLKFGAYLYGSNHNKYNGAAFPLNMNFGNKQVSSSSSPSTFYCFLSSPLSFSSSSSFPLSSSSSSFPLSSSSSSFPLSSSSSSFPLSSSSSSFPLSSSSSSFTSFLSTSCFPSSSPFVMSSSSSSSLPSQVSFPSSSLFSSSSSLSPSSSIPSLFPISSFSLLFHPIPSPVPFSSSPLSSSFPLYSSFSSPPFSSLQSLISSSSSLGVHEVTASVPLHKVCGCLCQSNTPWNITDELFEILREEVTNLLLLEPKNLSKTIRKLKSAQDNRPTAVAIGSVGTAFIVLTIVLILVPDVMSGLRYLFAEGETCPKVFQLVNNTE